MTRLALGIVADDLTGACDVAAAAREAGFSTVVAVGVPRAVPDADCVVVALKSRTIDPDSAVRLSRESAQRLIDRGVGVLYQKYCSTFDSTDRGNIGNVAEALADLVAGRSGRRSIAIGTPATPAVGRTVYRGHLFVGDRLLSESSLRDHPLTPMRDPDLVRVLARQSTRPVRRVDAVDVRTGNVGHVRSILRECDQAGAGHVIADAQCDDDLDVLADAVLSELGTDVLLCGAAGFAGALARRLAAGCRESAGEATPVLPPVPDGRRLILSGSGSEATRRQVTGHSGPLRTVDPLRLATGDDSVDAVVAWIRDHHRREHGSVPLVSATADPQIVRAAQDALGVHEAAELLERAIGEVAVAAVDELGVRRLIVAGGETSGAVAQALGVDHLHIGRSAAPGVPWAVWSPAPGRTAESVALLLKSGNFGGDDFFDAAWAVAP